jgi:hypothetical protein
MAYLVLASVGIRYLFSLGVPQARLNYHLHAGWNHSATLRVCTSSIASRTPSADSISTCAGPLESFPRHSGFLPIDELGSPWLDNPGPPGEREELGAIAKLSARRQCNRGQIMPCQENSALHQISVKNVGVSQHPLASDEEQKDSSKGCCISCVFHCAHGGSNAMAGRLQN